MSTDDPLGDEPFHYRATKNGLVHISRSGRVVTTLKGENAARFLTRAQSADAAELQLAMAKATGQYKIGTERAAKDRRDARACDQRSTAPPADSCFDVVRDHDAMGPEYLDLRAGERVRFERRDTEWEGWLWCTSASGQTGWVPEAWVELDASEATLRRDYCARELSVRRGERVSGSLIESGWLWATTPAGESGWIPLRAIEPCAGNAAI